MTLQRIDFKELSEGLPGTPPGTTRIFLPTGQPRNKANLPATSYKEEDLKTAERDGYKKGFTEGVADGRKQAETEQSETDRKLAAVLETFTAKLTPLFNDYRKMAVQLQEDAAKVAVAVAKKVAGSAIDQNSHDIVFETVTNCCASMMHEHKLNITVNEAVADTLSQRFKHLAASMPAAMQIVILRSPDMPMSDCKIEWDQGSMERSVEQILNQLEKSVDNMIAASKRDTQQQMDLLYAEIANTTNTKE